MPRDLFERYDTLLAGNFAALLKELAGEYDGSVEDVTWALRERGMRVATATVRRWLKKVEAA